MDDELPRWRKWLRGALRIGGLAALASLIAEFGFDLSGATKSVLHAVDVAVFAIFVADVLAKIIVGGEPVRRHWLELLLVALMVASIFWAAAFTSGRTLTRIYIVAMQLYLFVRLLLELARANEKLSAKAARPEWLLLGSFLLLIGAGTALLMMPKCRAEGAAPWRFVDALFTSTSAACVTGLTVRDTGSEFSMRGQAVVLGLIQLGGLGIVTIAMFITFLQRRRLELREMTLVRDMLNVQALGSLGRFLGYMLVITLVAELSGAAILYHATGKAWWSIFHSISAFCNAGFALDRDSLVPCARMPQILLTVAGLIVLGGIGFPVLLDLLSFELQSLPFVRRLRSTLRGGPEDRPPSRLSLHTKLALAATALLIVGGAALFHISEAKGVLAAQSPPEQVMTSLFQSVTTRTAGFNTVDIAALKDPTLLLFIVLMLIGASPVSTGGGMKTTTAAVLLLTVGAMIKNREPVEAFGRTIPRRIVNAAVAIVSMYVVATLVVTTLLLATQPQGKFLSLLFEAVSALGTVGLSAGGTSTLDDTGRLVICAAMFVGRVGPLAILWTFLSRPPGLQYEYPEEPVVVS